VQSPRFGQRSSERDLLDVNLATAGVSPVYSWKRRVRGAAKRLESFLGLVFAGKPIMAATLILVGALTVTGTDKMAETWLVDHMPEWLLALATRF
jgi:hypothetical protein